MDKMIKNKESTKLVGYCRVSTDNQKEEGTIEIQDKALKQYAAENNFELVKIFKDEAISGSSELENRPGLAGLFYFIENEKDIKGVLVYKLDRLARDLYIQEKLIKELDNLKLKLISINEPNLDSKDPMRKAFRQFMGIVSELEKAFITMRLSGGRINKAQKGGYAGGSTALGYIAKNNELKIDEEQADIVKKIFYLKRYKHLSLGKIAKHLNEEKIATKRGGKWYSGTIKLILERQLYKGHVDYKGNKTENKSLILV